MLVGNAVLVNWKVHHKSRTMTVAGRKNFVWNFSGYFCFMRTSNAKLTENKFSYLKLLSGYYPAINGQSHQQPLIITISI